MGIVTFDGKAYPSNLTLRVLITCLVASTGGLIFGYALGISGSNHRSSHRMINIAIVTRMLGRRVTMLSGGVLFAAGAILNGIAQKVWMLIIGHMLLGFGIGCANQSVPIYLSEIAPYKYRGALNMMFQLSITIGILAANVLNYFFAKIEGDLGWRLSMGCAIVPALIIILSSSFLPETPNSLIERGHNEEAKELLKKIRGIPNVKEEFNDLVAASEASKLVKHSWRNLLKRKYRPQLTMAICIPFFQQLTGMNVFMFYAPILFKIMGFGSNATLMSLVIISVVNALATFVSIFTVDKVGRRFLLLFGGSQMFYCQLVMIFAIAAKFGTSGNPGVLPRWYATLVVTTICIFIAGYAWSWGPLGWLVPSEIFPLEIRSAAQSINLSVNMIFTFAIAEVFTAMLCHMKFGLFIFFACFVIFMSLFTFKLLPETRGVPIEKMTIVWKNHPYWSKFVTDEPIQKEKSF